ncbi:DNA polymerase III subunit delta [Paenibacillus yanchengensis]|uniref:DNA polymerase III subunit delta n=1 Tax=Paenibacillus yanchengensis TaxID=2035833 RepID=A0ABW4YKE4_9BACL
MDISRAMKDVKEGKVWPIYVLVGEDRYRVQQFVTYLSETIFAVDERELGIVKFDTTETVIDEIILEAETVPFFLHKKLIIVHDALLLTAGGKDVNKLDHKPDALLRYLEHPLESSIVVFIAQAEKLDERRKVVKQLKSRQAVLTFDELDQAQMKQWLLRRIQKQGRTITEAAAALLQVKTGNHMQQLAQESDKLCLRVGEGGTIEESIVRELIPDTAEEHVFALVDAIVELRTEQALHLYKQLLLQREEPIKIIALIVRQIRMMLQIKELEQQHYSPKQMASILGQHPYAIKLAAEKGKRLKQQQLATILSQLADLDYNMKIGAANKTLALELFILSLAA